MVQIKKPPDSLNDNSVFNIALLAITLAAPSDKNSSERRKSFPACV